MHGKKSDPILEHYKSSGTYKTTNISIYTSTILFSLTQIKIYIYITHTLTHATLFDHVRVVLRKETFFILSLVIFNEFFNFTFIKYSGSERNCFNNICYVNIYF